MERTLEFDSQQSSWTPQIGNKSGNKREQPQFADQLNYQKPPNHLVQLPQLKMFQIVFA